MEHALELLDKHALGGADVTEGDWAFAEIAVGYHSVDDAVDESCDALFRVFLE